MGNLSNLIQFVERFVNSIVPFSNAIYGFMSYEVEVFDVTIFEIILGAGVAVYLTASITKWLIGIVT